MTCPSIMASPFKAVAVVCRPRSCRLCGTIHYRRLFASSAGQANISPDLPTERTNRQKWQSVIGLEIHAQINSASKLFSGAGTQYNSSTNTQVSFFDAALPGTLPVLNKKCVQAGVLTALALGCDINLVSKFDRKHYFYADLPAGYQITQQRQPLAINGHVTYVSNRSGTTHAERKSARLIQIQLEQDSGKSLHDTEHHVSLIDLNRAGIGLMEIVTAPDFTGGDDATSFVRDLRDILITLGTCDGKMSEGSLRVDANISVHRLGEPLGTRTEVKNLNSFRSMKAAIEYEIDRQIQVLENGGVVVNETRSFDFEDRETVPMRDKEKLLDYRFMPEPNLPPLVIHKDRFSIPLSMPPSQAVVLEDIQKMMKELPEMKRRRLEGSHGISLYNAVTIVRAGLTETFEALVTKFGCDPQITSSVLKNIYSSYLHDNDLQPSESPISNERLAEIIDIYNRKEISFASVSKVLQGVADNPLLSCEDIVKEQDLWAVKDSSVILAVIDGVLSRNPQSVKAYRKGKTNQLDIFLTKAMKKLEGKADLHLVREMIKDKLDNLP